MPTYKKIIGFYIEPEERPAWTGLIVNVETGELVPDPKALSMTKQSFKEECDINNIVRKFEATGEVDHINRASAEGLYIDLPSGLDLQAGLEMIRQAEGAFMALPAHVRAEFANDPVQFVEAFTNPSKEQQERFVALGLAIDTRPPETSPVVTPAPPDASDKP